MTDVPATLILKPDELLFSNVRLNQVREPSCLVSLRVQSLSSTETPSLLCTASYLILPVDI